MLKDLLNAQVDLLGEDRAGKILKKVQVSSANAAEQTLTDLLPQLAHLVSQSSGIEALENELPKTPEVAELKARSPAIYWILVTACEYGARARKKDIDKLKLASTVKERITNAISIESPYKAFAHAANLASWLYQYTQSTTEEGWRVYTDAIDVRRSVIPNVEPPNKSLYLLDYCNSDFRKVLFAACRYHGIDEERLPDTESLVDLLVGLGFTDRNRDDYVASFITLITGRFYKRNSYTHI